MILFISRAVDALTDPLYGYFIDKTKPKKFGRLKLWILISFPITAISYLMLWYIPDVSEEGKFVWFLLWNCIFFTVITGVRFPLISLNRYLTKSSKERESITIMRMGCEIVGVLAGIGIQAPFVTTNQKCKRLNETSFEVTNNYTNMTNASFDNKISFWDNKYFIVALCLTVIFALTHIALLVFVPEKEGLVKNINKRKK